MDRSLAWYSWSCSSLGLGSKMEKWKHNNSLSKRWGIQSSIWPIKINRIHTCPISLQVNRQYFPWLSLHSPGRRRSIRFMLEFTTCNSDLYENSQHQRLRIITNVLEIQNETGPSSKQACSFLEKWWSKYQIRKQRYHSVLGQSKLNCSRYVLSLK